MIRILVDGLWIGAIFTLIFMGQSQQDRIINLFQAFVLLYLISAVWIIGRALHERTTIELTFADRLVIGASFLAWSCIALLATIRRTVEEVGFFASSLEHNNYLLLSALALVVTGSLLLRSISAKSYGDTVWLSALWAIVLVVWSGWLDVSLLAVYRTLALL